MFYSWTPNRHAVKALGLAIRSHFEGPYHHYEAVPEDVQVRWWTEFKTRVTWTAQDEWQIKKVYETKVKKRLSDMLTKARDKRKRPHWIAKSQVDPPYQSEVSLESERFLFDISLCRADIKVGEVWKDPAKLGGTKTNSHETKTT
ncbi:hypothetical protein JHK84_038926 [Glycine max]|nr:hypothetical protein JHK84_038926 [Glycine max]